MEIYSYQTKGFITVKAGWAAHLDLYLLHEYLAIKSVIYPPPNIHYMI